MALTAALIFFFLLIIKKKLDFKNTVWFVNFLKGEFECKFQINNLLSFPPEANY